MSSKSKSSSPIDSALALGWAQSRIETAMHLQNQGQYARAICPAMRGLKGLQRCGGAVAMQIRAVTCLGISAWHYTGDVSKALEFFREANDIMNNSLEFVSEIQRINVYDNLGLAFHTVGQIDKSLEYLHSALELACNVNEAEVVRRIKRRLANAAQDGGHFELARRFIDEARPEPDAADDEQVSWLNASAILAERLGDLGKAEYLYKQSLKVWSRLGNRKVDFAAVVSNAALLFLDVGREKDAERNLRVLKKLCDESGTHSTRLGQLRLQARLKYARGDPLASANAWKQAEELIAKNTIANPVQLAEIATIRSAMLSQAGEKRAAEKHLSAYWPKSARCLIELEENLIGPVIARAGLLLELRDKQDVKVPLKAAFVAQALGGGAESDWRLFDVLAELADRMGASLAAIVAGKLAVEAIVNLTSTISGTRNERSAFQTERIRPFAHLIKRLVDQGRFPEAASIQSSLKSEQHFDFASRDLRMDLRQNHIPFRLDEARLIRQIRATRERLHRLHLIEKDWRIERGERRSAAKKVVKTRQKIAVIFDDLLAQSWTNETLVVAAHNQMREQAGIARLHYYQCDTHFVGRVDTDSGSLTFNIPFTFSELAQLVFDYRGVILNRRSDHFNNGTTLFNFLIRPALELLGGQHQVQIVADNFLSSLPFACLWDGERYLIEKMAIAYCSGSNHRCDNRVKSPIRISAFGVDRRLANLSSLQHVAGEIQTIQSIFPDAIALLNEDFSARSFAEELRRGSNVVHIASHFHLEPASAHLSQLALGDGSFMELSTLRGEEIKFDGVDLLVLSACETGLADHGVNGVESFAAIAQAKGVGTVVATLWSIADAAASQFSSAFYASLIESAGKADPIESLRLAQCAMLGSNVTNMPDLEVLRGLGISKKPIDQSHPYHWAGFSVYV